MKVESKVALITGGASGIGKVSTAERRSVPAIAPDESVHHAVCGAPSLSAGFRRSLA